MPTIRAATPEDAPSVARLLTASGRPSDTASTDAGQVLVAEDGGEAIGVLRVLRRGPDGDGAPQAAIAELYVDPTHRRKRIGMLLVAEAERMMRDQGGLEMNVSVDEASEIAVGFFRAMGYSAHEGGFRKALPPKRSAKSRRAEG